MNAPIQGNRKTSNDSNISSQLSEREMYTLKTIIVGDIAVGKTALLSRFVTDTFSNEYKCNVGVEFKVKKLFIDETMGAELHIWDTCGEEKFRSITRQYYYNANGIIVMFDLTNKVTFDNLEFWLNDIKNCIEEVEIVVIGNKCDLKAKRQVSAKEIDEYMRKRDLSYFEASAKDGTNIEVIFEALAKKLCLKEIVRLRIEEKKAKEKKKENEKMLLSNNANALKAHEKNEETCC